MVGPKLGDFQVLANKASQNVHAAKVTGDLKHTVSVVKRELASAIHFQPQNAKIPKHKILWEVGEICSLLSLF